MTTSVGEGLGLGAGPTWRGVALAYGSQAAWFSIDTMVVVIVLRCVRRPDGHGPSCIQTDQRAKQ